MLSFNFDNLTGKRVRMNNDIPEISAFKVMWWWKH